MKKMPVFLLNVFLCLAMLFTLAACDREESLPKRCESCGEKISSEDAYCRYCGVKVKKNAEKKPKAVAKVYILQNEYVDAPGYSSGDVAVPKELTDTFIVISQSNNVLNRVRENLDFPISVSELRNSMQFETVGDTELISISVVADTGEDALKILDAFLKEAPEAFAEIVEGVSFRVVDGPNLQRIDN